MQVTVEFKFVTCFCGVVYAVPGCLSSPACPACSRRALEEREKWQSEAEERAYRLELQVRALRGVITRLRPKGRER